MNFIIEAQLINQISKNMGALLNSRTTIPILTGVLINVSESDIRFTVSDGTDTLVQRIIKTDGIEINTTGTAVFPKDFFTAIRKMSGLIEVCINGNSVLVKKGKTELTFTMMLADEYPPITQQVPTSQLRYAGAVFKQIVDATTFNAATEETRPVLMGVNLKMDGKVQQFVGTNSHHLGKFVVETSDCLEDENHVNQTIPARVLDHAVKTFDLNKDVFLLNFPNQIALANGNVIYYSRLLEGNYPETNRLIPQEFNTEIVINKKELSETLTLLKEVTENSIVTFTLDGGLFIKIAAHNSLAKGVSEIAYTELIGDNDLKIGFSSQYLLHALSPFSCDSVKISFVGSMRPFTVRSTDPNDTQIQLILPVRTY